MASLAGIDSCRLWRWNVQERCYTRPAIICLAASGGSKRDMQKIAARTKHRRARHMKMLNRPNLYDELDQLPKLPDGLKPETKEETSIHQEVTAQLDGTHDVNEENQATVPLDSREDERSEFKEENQLQEDTTHLNTMKDVLKEKDDNKMVTMENSKETTPENTEQLEGKLTEEDILGKDPKDIPIESQIPVVPKLEFPEISQRDQDHRTTEELQKPEDSPAYNDCVVFVAGASGRTGRLIVENLANKGAKVFALVRDLSKGSQFKHLSNVKVVRGDICKYETLKQALDNSNVVICATGSQAFPLDILQTYQVEYEGVLNLISAAKNQGNVKKFILVTSIGVSSIFQLVPILWWKRQAELALQRSGLNYTIIRPAGLREYAPDNEGVEMKPADSILLGGISRKKVAEVCVEAIRVPEASEKIVEIIGGGNPKEDISQLFSSV